MKIGIIHPYFDVIGGAEMTSLSLMNELKESNHFTTLYTVKPPAITETENFKINITKQKKIPSFWHYQRMQEVKELFKKAENSDILLVMSGGLTLAETNIKKIILYCNSTFSGEKSLLKLEKKGVKGLYLNVIKKNIRKNIEFLKSEKIHLISNSIYTKENIKNECQKDSNVIYPPVRIDRFQKLQNKQKLLKVSTLSRFSSEKNLEFAIDLIKNSGLEYNLIGNAIYKKQTELYKKLKMNESQKIKLYCNITQDKIEELISQSYVYFHPSEETFGISVIESIAAGCIPIVPDNSAHKETVPFDDLRFKTKEDAIQKIKFALEGKYDRLKPELQNYIKRFSENNFQKSFLNYIEN